jgi:hypothetical protein
MLNDDVHTFNDVEGLLQQHCGMTQPQAHAAANLINEDGECIVFEGTLQAVKDKCAALVTSCKRNDRARQLRARRFNPLGLIISTRSRRPLEVRALHLLRWLYAACCNSDIVRALLCGSLLSTPEQVQQGVINYELLFGDVSAHIAFMPRVTGTPLNMLACIGSHSATFKYTEVCKLLQDIFIQLLNESSFKYGCASVLIENLVRAGIPFERTPCKVVMFPLTVQILTVPSIVSVIATDLLYALLWYVFDTQTVTYPLPDGEIFIRFVLQACYGAACAVLQFRFSAAWAPSRENHEVRKQARAQQTMLNMLCHTLIFAGESIKYFLKLATCSAAQTPPPRSWSRANALGRSRLVYCPTYFECSR